ncbi:MAG TPA: hypothetical protein VMU87_22740 [Stellaceae bacterium]|nr:hypothetical protein [Stellaceae bacterium]
MIGLRTTLRCATRSSIGLRTTLRCATAVAFLLTASLARADGAVNVTDLSGLYGGIGTTPSLCVPAATSRATLFLYNSGATNIGYSFGPTPALGASGTVELLAGGSGWAYWGPGAAPSQAIWCVSSGAGGALTIIVGNQ